MTKKEKLIELFQRSITNNTEYIAIAVETRGNEDVEFIINSKKNFKNKMEYYNKAYNDDLILNTYDGIKIVSMCEIQGNMPMDIIYGTVLHIKTLEGNHHVSVGDYVIKGVQGELYPCKPDIFEAGYDSVEE